jgi:hypothetical protein
VLMPERAHNDISLEYEEAQATAGGGVKVPAGAQTAD